MILFWTFFQLLLARNFSRNKGTIQSAHPYKRKSAALHETISTPCDNVMLKFLKFSTAGYDDHLDRVEYYYENGFLSFIIQKGHIYG